MTENFIHNVVAVLSLRQIGIISCTTLQAAIFNSEL
jgi:hypothetical protein